MSEEHTHGLNDDEVVDQIEALIAGQDEEPDTPEKVEAVEPEETQEPEEVEVEEEGPDIDYDLEIPMADGRDAMSISALKDAVTGAERGKADFEKARMKLIADEEQFNQYVAQSGVEIPQEFKQHIQKQQGEHLEHQHQLMLKMMPELADKTAFDSMRAGIVEAAAASNFTEQEIGQITDARVVHLINRLAVLETEKAKASEKVEQIRKKSGPKGVVRRNKTKTSDMDKIVANAAGSSDSEVKAAAIEALLG